MRAVHIGRSPRSVAQVAAGGVFVLLAAACGSSATTASSPSASASVASSSSNGSVTAAPVSVSGVGTAALDKALHAQLPSAVTQKGSLTVALDATYAPDEFVDSSGKIVGMDADLAYELGDVLGVKMKLVNATFDTIIPGLVSGKFDIGDSSFTDTKAREKTVNFVDYFVAGEGFYEAANSTGKFNGLQSLCGHTVAVENGTTEQSDAQGLAKKCKVTVLSLADQNQANLAVSSGRAQVGFADSQVAAYIVAQSHGQFKNVGTPFSTAPYGIAVPKNGPTKALLSAMKDLMSDGIYKKVLQKWGNSAGAISAPTINGATS